MRRFAWLMVAVLATIIARPVTLVRWTEQAADDLAAIREFLVRDSPAYAHVIAERLYTSVGHLRGFPELGRMVPERADHDLRELVRRAYRIVYRRTPPGISSRL